MLPSLLAREIQTGFKQFLTVGFEPQHPGYEHQEAARLRLASDQQAAPTLVATGSAKTECFLYGIDSAANRTCTGLFIHRRPTAV